MAIVLKAKRLDISTGRQPVVVFNEEEAAKFGIHREDRLKLKAGRHIDYVLADFTGEEVKRGEAGLFKEVWQESNIKTGDTITIELIKRPPSVEAINKKLLGNELSYEEIYSIIDDIVKDRLGDTETTYFVATGFCQGWNNEEMYHLTKAMAQTGDTLNMRGTVVDIHSIGGVPGDRSTMLAAPIAAAIGFIIPKSSTRAITSPSGVADTMETLARVDLSLPEIKKQCETVGATLAWGGSVNMAPADDKIIRYTYPLAMEPYSKMVVSIMAKKVAMGVDYFTIEMPVGETAKVQKMSTARDLERQFQYIGRKFGMKVKVHFVDNIEPTGHGVGPALECRDVLRVLQRKQTYSRTLERTALRLVANVAALTGKYSFGSAYRLGKKALDNGSAWKKMQGIIKAQGPQKGIKPDIDSEDVVGDKVKTKDIESTKRGHIFSVSNHALNDIARILGAPFDKRAGIYLHKRVKQRVVVKDKMFTLYAENEERLELAEKALLETEIYKIG